MGQADMKWLNQSVHTQSWCETVVTYSYSFDHQFGIAHESALIKVVEAEHQSQLV